MRKDFGVHSSRVTCGKAMEWNGTPCQTTLGQRQRSSHSCPKMAIIPLSGTHSRLCWRRAAANLGGHTVLRHVWHGRDQAWRRRQERPMLATPHREQPTCQRTGSLPHSVQSRRWLRSLGPSCAWLTRKSAKLAPTGAISGPHLQPQPPRWNGEWIVGEHPS